MSRKRIANVLRKEWAVIFKDLNNTLFVSLIPFLIVVQSLAYVWLISHFGGEALLTNNLILNALSGLSSEIPSVTGLPENQQLLVLLLSQFKFFLLLIPTMISVSFATFSIVEEKQSRSLEPLLATPVKTWELLSGKALSGAIPALLLTWICAAIFFGGVAVLGWGDLIKLVLTPSWYMTFFLLTPAVAALSFLLGVIGSSRAKDAKSAQNLILVVIFPVFALIGIQVTGIIWFTPLLTLVLAIAIFIVDYLVLRAAVGLFQRESIIIKWR